MTRLHIVRMTLELRSPLHIGSGIDDPLLDAPVVRDAFGDYRLPGSSIAGAARAFAGRRGIEGIFGCGGDQARASAIEFSDGLILDWDGEAVLEKRLRGESPALGETLEVQERVRIDHVTGAADEAGKFDAEIVPQGLRFRIEIAFNERWAAGGQGGAQDVAAFAAVTRALATGAVPLGGSLTDGLGLVAAVAGSESHDVYDLSTVAGMEAARNRPAALSPGMSRAGLPGIAGPLPEAAAEDGLAGKVTMRMKIDGPLLVGGSQRPRGGRKEMASSSADLVFGETIVADYAERRFVSRPWVPGSALKGVIRHRVWHIVEAVGVGDPVLFVDQLFGSVSDAAARPSKITVLGQVLEEMERTVVSHVAIDRLTGGSLRGALYSEAPIWKDGIHLDVELRFDGVTHAEAAVVAHALLDLARGELPVGGGGNRGNGTLTIAAETEPGSGLAGRAVSLDVHDGPKRWTHASPLVDLNNLLDSLDAALAGATLSATGRV